MDCLVKPGNDDGIVIARREATKQSSNRHYRVRRDETQRRSDGRY
jgi:hypothetical protein